MKKLGLKIVKKRFKNAFDINIELLLLIIELLFNNIEIVT